MPIKIDVVQKFNGLTNKKLKQSKSIPSSYKASELVVEWSGLEIGMGEA